MPQSINTKVDLVVEGTSFLGMTDYGKIMIGDRGFEFFNDRDVRKFVQIPWDEVDYVIVSVIFKGKWIPRFAMKTKKNGTYSFAAKDPKQVLRAIRNYVDPDRIVRSLGMWDVIKRGVKRLVTRKSH
ncbi:DUF956 family protein [Pediococcus cellicola]|nr:DUF956 family protein [Pediococcus cellicola]GEL14579.1 hypothetical protein PCE01_03810 [Pediococcus cellicola]